MATQESSSIIEKMTIPELVEVACFIQQDINQHANAIAVWRQLRLLMTISSANQVVEVVRASIIHQVFNLVALKDQARDSMAANAGFEKAFERITEQIAIGGEEEQEKNSEQLLSFFLQFLANFVTAHKVNKMFVITKMFDKAEINTRFIALISRIYSERLFGVAKLRKFVATFLFNLLKDLPVSLLEDTLMISPTFRYILLGVLRALFNDTTREGEQTLLSPDEDQQESQAAYWSLLLVSAMFTKCNDATSSSRSIVKYFEELVESEHEKESLHLLLFHLCQKFVDEKCQHSLIAGLEVTIVDVRETYGSKQLDYSFQFSQSDLQHFSEDFANLRANLRASLESCNAFTERKTFDISPSEKEKFTSLLHVTHDRLRLFCVLTFLGGYNNVLQRRLLELGVMETTLKLNEDLQELNANAEVATEQLPRCKIQQHSLNFFEETAYRDIFSSIMRMLSNMVHIHRAAQDYILQTSRLVSCLSQTYMDDKNPLQREWSIMLIRNICDGNEEMQLAISKLEVRHFSEKTKEVLDKYQAKKEEIEKIRALARGGAANIADI